MIVNELTLFLTGIVAQERIDVYTKILSLLEERGVFTSNYYIMELISTREQYENQEIIHRMDDIFFEQLSSVFEDLGITTEEEIPLHELLVLLDAVLSIETFEDQKAINSLIESADDKEEAFCKVLGYVSGLPEETFTVMITDVKDETLVNISNLYEDDSEDDNDMIHVPDNVDGQYEKIKERVRIYLNNHEDNIIKYAVEQGLRLRGNWMSYFKFGLENRLIDFTTLTSSSLPSKEEKKSFEKMIEQFMGISLMAGVSSAEATSYITEVVSQAALAPSVAANLIAQSRETAMRALPNG